MTDSNVTSLSDHRQTVIDETILGYRNAIQQAFPSIPHESIVFQQALVFSEVLAAHAPLLLDGLMVGLKDVAVYRGLHPDEFHHTVEEDTAGLIGFMIVNIRAARLIEQKCPDQEDLHLVDDLLDVLQTTKPQMLKITE